MTEEGKKEPGEITRREFLKDAGIIVGGAAVGSTALLVACGGEEVTKTVTTTKTAAEATVTETVSKFVCPSCGQEFDTLDALTAHMESAHPGEVETITKFVCPICSQEFASLAALQTHFEAAHPAEVVEVPEKLTKLTVNGKTHELKLEPQWTLAKVLREELLLTGTKIGCDIGECGNCTVIMDGKPVYSCLVLAAEAEGKDIVTIEGLAEWSDGALKLHPIQEAVVEKDAIQCGWCVPGFIMAAKGLLDVNQNPTQQEAMEAISGCLCRCMGYWPVTDSILLAAEKIRTGGGM